MIYYHIKKKQENIEEINVLVV